MRRGCLSTVSQCRNMKSSSRMDVYNKVTQQGDLLRKLKTDKAEKSDITAAVTLLKELKIEYESTTGQAYEKGVLPGEASTTSGDAAGDLVTPWDVQAAGDEGIDYDKLIDRFGSTPISPELLERCEKLTGKPVHRFLRRGIFFSHREFEQILGAGWTWLHFYILVDLEKGVIINHVTDLYEKKKPFYLYTGRGPSSEAMHLGHLVPFIMTKWLQDTFDVPLVVQLTDDEKFLWKDLELEECEHLARQNSKGLVLISINLAS